MEPDVRSIDMERFKAEALPVIEKLAGHFGIDEAKAVEAYGRMLSLVVTHEEYFQFLDKSQETLPYESCLELLRHMTTKNIKDLIPEEGDIGLCLGLLRERHEPMRVHHVGRNESCPCGSGRKYKKCCLGGNLNVQQEDIYRLIGNTLD